MTGHPFLCPDCGCPIQLLAKNGYPDGSIEDALEAHNAVVHKNEPEVTA